MNSATRLCERLGSNKIEPAKELKDSAIIEDSKGRLWKVQEVKGIEGLCAIEINKEKTNMSFNDMSEPKTTGYEKTYRDPNAFKHEPEECRKELDSENIKRKLQELDKYASVILDKVKDRLSSVSIIEDRPQKDRPKECNTDYFQSLCKEIHSTWYTLEAIESIIDCVQIGPCKTTSIPANYPDKANKY